MAVCDSSSIVEQQQGFILLQEAVKLVLIDDGFSLPSESCKKARVAAELMDCWMKEERNVAACKKFAHALVQHIKLCIPEDISRKSKSVREKMWESFHKLKCSSVFLDLWKSAFSAMGSSAGDPTPVFFQFVTDTIMERLIPDSFPIGCSCSTDSIEESLDYEERNALRYTADGYVLHSMVQKMKKGKGNEEMLSELNRVIDENKEDDMLDSDSREWAQSIDCGGLVRINDLVYTLFVTLELLFRQYLKTHKIALDGFDLNAVNQVLRSDNDVLFYWSLITADIDDNCASKLLEMIVEHWITLRGFSYASSIMEKYKQTNKKNIEKSKGLRKTLINGAEP